MHGSHCIRHWSSTQPNIALSSGEAELGGLTKGAAQGIGLRSIGTDLGLTFSLKMHTDATAAMGMSRRLGLVRSDIWTLLCSGFNRWSGLATFCWLMSQVPTTARTP